jgi:hypothetical protein
MVLFMRSTALHSVLSTPPALPETRMSGNSKFVGLAKPVLTGSGKGLARKCWFSGGQSRL